MKEHDCSIFLEEVLTAGKPLSAEAAKHVQICSECAALRETAERCSGHAGTALEIPAALDQAILAYAGEARRRRNFHQLFFRRVIPAFAAAAAAVVCVVALQPEETPAIRGAWTAADITLAAADAVTEWNMLESEACSLNYELTSCQQLMAELQGI